MTNDFILQLQAMLDRKKSQKQINSDIKELQKSIGMLRLTATLLKGETKKSINQVIQQMDGQLNQIKLKTKIDQKNLKSDISKILNNLSYKDIDLGVNTDKTKIKFQKAVADVKKVAQSNPISLNVNIDIKKEKLENQLTTYLSRNSKITESKALLGEVEQLRSKIAGINDRASLRDATDSFQLFKSQVAATGFQTKSTADKIKGLLGNVTKIGSAFGVTTLAVNKFQESLQTVKTNDTILTEISKTSDATKKELEKLGNEAFDTASKYGQSSSDYLTAIQEMNRSGFYGEVGKSLGELSLKAQAAGDVTAETAEKYLLATNAAYNYKGSVEKLTAVLDGQNFITNNYSTDMETMASATEKAGSVAANAGVKIDQLSAMIGTISSRTKGAGGETGTGIKSLLINLQNISSDKIVNTLKKANASMTETVDGIEKLRNPIEILKDLAKTYNSLEESDPLKSEITTNIGQKYHANQLSALLSGWEDYEKMLKTYSEGMGSSEEEAAKTAESLTGRLQALQNSWDELVNTITSKDTIKGGVAFLDNVLQSATKLIDTIGEIPVAIAALNTGMTALNKNYGINQLFKDGKVDIQGNLFGIDFTQIKHFKEASTAIAKWNNELKSGQAYINDFGEEIVKNNAQLREYLATCSSDAPASLEGYKAHLTAAGVTTDALRLKTILLNSAIGLGFGLAVQAAVSGISYLIHYEEKQKEIIDNAKKSTEECANAIRDLKSEMSDTTTKASELSAEFAKLVQGVDPLTNKNLKLSTEDYERFLDVNKQLSDLFPSLTKNYDENGNAILGLSGDVDTVTESIAKLVEQQNNLAKAEIRGKLNDYVNGTDDSEGVFTALEGYKQDLSDAESALKEFEDTYNSLIGGKDSNTTKRFNFYQEYVDYLDDIKDKFGEDISEAIEGVSREFENGVNTNGVTVHFDELEIDEETKSKITESYNTFVQDYKTSVDVAKSELESKNNEMSNMMMTWVEDIDLYKDGGDTFQKAIENIVGSIQWDQVGVEEGNLDDAKGVIQETVLAPLNAACDDPDKKLQVTNALNKLFTVDFSQMSFQEASKMIEGFLTTIMEALNKGVPDDQKKSMPDMYEMFGLSNYSETADKMKNSLASIAEEGSADYNELASYTNKFNQSQVETWLSATKGANGATDAIAKYERALADAAETASAPISFSEAWEHLQSVGEKAKDVTPELLKLAKAGEISDATLISNEDYVTLLTETKMSARDARREIMSMLSVQEKMSGLQGKIG